MANTVTLTVTITFRTDNCADVDPENYDPIPDLEETLGFGEEHYNIEDWQVVSPQLEQQS